MAFQSKDSTVLDIQNKVQTLVLAYNDPCVTIDTVTCTVDVGETIGSVRACTFIDNSAATSEVIAAAARTISGTTVALTLSAQMAANDAVILHYVVSE